MSNAKYRPADTSAKPREGAAPHPLDPVLRCQHDEKLFALYLELGGATVDASLRFLQRVIEDGKRSLEIGFASEREEWGKHEKDPAYQPRRLRPAVSTSEALRAVRELRTVLDDRHKLMARACELADLGRQAAPEYLAAARAAFAAFRESRAPMVMALPVMAQLEQAAPTQKDVPAVRESHAASAAA